MFKFDPKQVIHAQRLKQDHNTWVSPYKEGNDEQKWIVKCIHVNKHEEINNILQNMFLQTSSNSPGLLPVMGYDVQKDELGQSKIYLRMPRMKESLRNIIDEHCNSLKTEIPLEKIVQYLYSIANTLDELAQKHIFHRNLKPTNVLIDREGMVYLTDLRLNQYIVDNNAQEDEKQDVPEAQYHNIITKDSSENNDYLYLAPELYNNYLAPSEEDIYKADVWSLGMILAEACLLNRLQFTPPEFPLQDQIDTAEQNIAEIRNIYGEKLAYAIAGTLNVNPSQRSTFKEICENLEENFAELLPSRQESELMKLSFKSKTNSRIFYSDYSIDEESYLGNPFLKEEDELSHRHAFMLDLSQSKDNILDRSTSEDFNHENRQSMYQKVIRMKNRMKMKLRHIWEKPFKLKDIACSYKLAIILAIVIILILTVPSQIMTKNKMKYMRVLHGLEGKYNDQFKITLDPHNPGILTIESFGGGHHKTDYWNPPNSPWEYHRNAYLDSLMKDLASQSDAEDLFKSVTDLRITLSEQVKVSDRSLQQMQITLLKFKHLKSFSFQKIDGPITDLGMNTFMAFLAQKFKDLEGLSIGFLRGGNPGPDGPERDWSISIDGLYPFANQVLKDFKKLTSYTLNFERMDIVTDVLLNQLSAHLNEYGGNLKFFDLKISGCTKLTTEGLKQFNSLFLNSLGNLKQLGVNYKGTNLDNDGLNQLVVNICEKTKNLHTLGLSLENTYINTDAVSNFATVLKENPPKDLKQLLIQTSIWDRDFLAQIHEQLKFIQDVIILP